VLDRSTVTELTVADATVTVASAVTAVGVALVTVRTYVVVAVGLTLTPTPLVAVRLPGVITPVPFANTAVRVALDPVVMVPEFAVKLAIDGGGGGGGVLDDPPPQPVKLARPRLRVIASRVRIRRRFIGFPVFRTREVLIRTAASATALFSE
jgi:hypothetical protein